MYFPAFGQWAEVWGPQAARGCAYTSTCTSESQAHRVLPSHPPPFPITEETMHPPQVVLISVEHREALPLQA